jgi:hypothetical protein
MPARDDGAPVLDASVTTTVDEDGGGALDLSFTVRNAGDEPVECSFPDGQRVEAVAERDSGGGDGAGDDGAGEVWRYGDGQLFSMALGTETIPPGGEATFDATWPDPDPGEYRVRAWLAATGVDASAETRVSVA